MTKPRYSIIPAAAVTDPRLEGRDLQVLCLLGRHTNKLGWCFRSQVEMAQELDCARSTVQLSLSRLIAAGWIETRSCAVTDSGRPYASYAYRVRMDHDDPDIAPSDDEIEARRRDGGCPRVGTPADRSAPVPILGRHPGADACIGTERPRSNDQEIDRPRAREDSMKEAQQVADACVVALGFEAEHPPIELAGLTYQISIMLERGYDAPRIIAAFARFAGQQPVKPLSYFVKVVETACTAQPLAPPSTEKPDGSDETVQDGFVSRIDGGKSRDLRSIKERRNEQVWDRVSERIRERFGVSGEDGAGACDEASAPNAGRLPKP